VFKKLGTFALVEMFVFLLILFAGFVYLWARGDLEWVRSKPEVPHLDRKIIIESKKETKKAELEHV
jgi:NADH-quinone oxidoreductase subunit A